MDSRSGLQRRVSIATQKDVLLGLFLESSLGHVAATLGEGKRELLRSEILQGKSITTFFRYPVMDLLRLVDRTLTKEETDAEFTSGVEQFGRAAVRYFMESPVGKTMTLLAGGNVHRLLASAPAGYRAVTSFGERSYVKMGEKRAEMRFNNELLGSGWQSGVVKQALENVCDVRPEITSTTADPADTSFTLHISW